MRGSAIFFPRQWHVSRLNTLHAALQFLGYSNPLIAGCTGGRALLQINDVSFCFSCPFQTDSLWLRWEKRSFNVSSPFLFTGWTGRLKIRLALRGPAQLVSACAAALCGVTGLRINRRYYGEGTLINIHELSPRHWIIIKQRQQDLINIKKAFFNRRSRNKWRTSNVR